MITLPLRSGPDIDWRTKCIPGDCQGETDACAVFAVANWVECMLGQPISNEAAIELWRAERQFRYRDLSGGITVPEAFAGAMIRVRWLPHGTMLRRVGNLETLPLAPLIVCFTDLAWTLQPPLGRKRICPPDPRRIRPPRRPDLADNPAGRSGHDRRAGHPPGGGTRRADRRQGALHRPQP